MSLEDWNCERCGQNLAFTPSRPAAHPADLKKHPDMFCEKCWLPLPKEVTK